MKGIAYKVCRILLYPLIRCYHIVMEAPLIDFGTEFVGYSDCARYMETGKKEVAYSHSKPGKITLAHHS